MVCLIGLVVDLSVNVGCGAAEERVLLTGLHAVADIYCECCKTTLGWKYVSIDSFSFFCLFLPKVLSLVNLFGFERLQSVLSTERSEHRLNTKRDCFCISLVSQQSYDQIIWEPNINIGIRFALKVELIATQDRPIALSKETLQPNKHLSLRTFGLSSSCAKACLPRWSWLATTVIIVGFVVNVLLMQTLDKSLVIHNRILEKKEKSKF